MSLLDELWDVVSSVPAGHVAAYGDVGAALSRPVSGVLVGKWMAQCPSDRPWWRVVGRSGDLLVGKRDPRFAAEQTARLEAEGVSLDDGKVPGSYFWVP